MKDIKIYHFLWERIILNEEREVWLNDSIKSLNKKSDYGLYQLYGDHPVYGPDKLLYIGKAEEQTFQQRISKHKEWCENNIKRYTRIHIGRLAKMEDGTAETWGEIISKSEKLILNAYNPALNKQDVNKISDIKNHFMIINWFDYGDIYPEVSSLRFSYHYWDQNKFKFDYLIES